MTLHGAGEGTASNRRPQVEKFVADSTQAAPSHSQQQKLRLAEQSCLSFKRTADLEASLKGVVREPSLRASGDVSSYPQLNKVTGL